MTTLDRINSELTTLQEELSQLQHFTEEIGMAKEASVNVVAMSKDFIVSFQKRVEIINNEMNKAALEFSKACSDSSKELDEASKIFQKGINDAKTTLSDVGTELGIVAEKVNELALKIDSINILGHFERIHTTLNEIKIDELKNFEKLLNIIASLDFDLTIDEEKEIAVKIVTQSYSVLGIDGKNVDIIIGGWKVARELPTWIKDLKCWNQFLDNYVGEKEVVQENDEEEDEEEKEEEYEDKKKNSQVPKKTVQERVQRILKLRKK
jgi:hypothetical protein